MSSDHVSLERDGAIAVVRLNRPPANALEMEFSREFEAAFDSMMRDEPEAMVLTGTGRFFSTTIFSRPSGRTFRIHAAN